MASILFFIDKTKMHTNTNKQIFSTCIYQNEEHLSSDMFFPILTDSTESLISIFTSFCFFLSEKDVFMGTRYLQECFNYMMQQRITLGGMFIDYLVMAMQFSLKSLSNLSIYGWVYKVSIFDVLNFLKVLIFCQSYCHKNLSYLHINNFLKVYVR